MITTPTAAAAAANKSGRKNRGCTKHEYYCCTGRLKMALQMYSHGIVSRKYIISDDEKVR